MQWLWWPQQQQALRSWYEYINGSNHCSISQLLESATELHLLCSCGGCTYTEAVRSITIHHWDAASLQAAADYVCQRLLRDWLAIDIPENAAILSKPIACSCNIICHGLHCIDAMK